MSIRGDEFDGVCVLTVDGDLSGEAVADAQRAADEALSRPGGRGVVFDMEECEFVDSAGLEMLLRVRRQCQEAGGSVALARVGNGCAKILEITRLAGHFEYHADLGGAPRAAR